MKNTKRRRRRGPVAAPIERREPAARPDPSLPPDRRIWLVAIPLVLLVIAAFFPALGNGFVEWDDQVNFLQNPNFWGLGPSQVAWAWSTFRLGVYQPLAWMLLETEYALWGLDPRGYHLTSVLLHAADVAVLYVLMVALLLRCRPDAFRARPWACALGAGLATALFAVHPLRVETVAWASCQPYLPCALFAMLAVLAYLRAVGDGTGGPPRWGWLAGSFAMFVAAMLCKAAAIPLPAVLLILDVYPLGRLGGGPGRWLGSSARKVWLEKVPFVAMSLVFMGLAIAAKVESETLVPLDRGVSGRIPQACYGVWFYIVKTVIPRDLAAFYPLPRRIDWSAPPFLASIVATAAVSVGLFLLRRRSPGALAAWLSYLVILAPSSGLVRIGNQVAADRYSYLPMMALVVLAAAGLGLTWAAVPARRRATAPVLAAVGGAAILALIVLTGAQCRTWSTSESLWSHSLAHGGASGTAYHALGSVRLAQRRIDEAKERFEEAIRLEPENAPAYHGLGLVLLGRGKLAEARERFEQALRIYPRYAEAHNGLGAVLFQQGRIEEAADEFEQTRRLAPDTPSGDNGLGWVLLGQRRPDEAADRFERSARLDPRFAPAHRGLGAVRALQGRYQEALGQFEQAIRLDPAEAESLNDRAMLLASCPDPRYRDGKKAVESATRACELIGWSQATFLDTLAAAYAEAGDFAPAVRWQEKAIGLLQDEREKDDYRSRLALYRAGQPFRSPPPAPAPAPAGGRP